MRASQKFTWASLVAGFGAIAIAACVSDEPSNDSSQDGGTQSDATTDGSSVNDGSSGGDAAVDAGPCPAGSDGVDCGGGNACYHGVCDGKRPVKIAAGGSHACAILKSGDVWCWGRVDYGAVGSSLDAGSACPASGTASCLGQAVQVAGIGDAIDVACGYDFTCVVKRDGSTWCWGKDHRGQLGHNPVDDPYLNAGLSLDPTPAPVVAPANANIIAVAASQESVCALKQGGQVICWGNAGSPSENLYDIVDAGTGSLFGYTPALADNLGPGSGADAIFSEFGSHYAVHKTDGSVWSWGYNNSRERGNTDPSGSLASPARFSDGGVAGPFSTVSVGEGPTAAGVMCGILGGALWCWGDNTGYYAGSSIPSSSPPALSATSVSFSAISGSALNVCGISTSNDVYCWARGTHGESGDGVTADAGPPAGAVTCSTVPEWCVQAPTQVSGLKAVAVTVGPDFALVIRDNGQVYAWGQNDFGQLGHPPGTQTDTAHCGESYITMCNGVPRPVEGLPTLP